MLKMKNRTSISYLSVTLLNVIITIAEFIGGFLSGSLALLSAAVDNVSDVGSILLSFSANLIAHRQRDSQKTFGYARAETLAAFTNSVVLIVISLYLLIEAVQRFSHPAPIRGQIMFIASLVGLAGNAISMLIMMHDAKNSLNAKVIFINMLSDSLSSVAVVVSSLIIYLWHITIVDPILTILTALFLFRESVKVTRKATDILMEGNPNIDLKQIYRIMSSFPEVKNVHHVHVWQYSDQIIMLDAHINVAGDMKASELEKLYGQIAKKLKQDLGIGHVTLQAESERGQNEKMVIPGKQE